MSKSPSIKLSVVLEVDKLPTFLIKELQEKFKGPDRTEWFDPANMPLLKEWLDHHSWTWGDSFIVEVKNEMVGE